MKPSSSNSSAEPAEPSAADGDGFPSLSSAPSDAKQPKKGKKVLQPLHTGVVFALASCKYMAVLPPEQLSVLLLYVSHATLSPGDVHPKI